MQSIAIQDARMKNARATSSAPRRATPEYSYYATAVTLHAEASTRYRRLLHSKGAYDPETLTALRAATVQGFYLADARQRLAKARAKAGR